MKCARVVGRVPRLWGRVPTRLVFPLQLTAASSVKGSFVFSRFFSLLTPRSRTLLPQRFRNIRQYAVGAPYPRVKPSGSSWSKFSTAEKVGLVLFAIVGMGGVVFAIKYTVADSYKVFTEEEKRIRYQIHTLPPAQWEDVISFTSTSDEGTSTEFYILGTTNLAPISVEEVKILLQKVNPDITVVQISETMARDILNGSYKPWLSIFSREKFRQYRQALKWSTSNGEWEQFKGEGLSLGPNLLFVESAPNPKLLDPALKAQDQKQPLQAMLREIYKEVSRDPTAKTRKGREQLVTERMKRQIEELWRIVIEIPAIETAERMHQAQSRGAKKVAVIVSMGSMKQVKAEWDKIKTKRG